MFPLLTADDARDRLRDDGVLALGLTAVVVRSAWSAADITVDLARLTLTTSTPVLAPFTGLRRQVEDLAIDGVFDVDGDPVTGNGTRLDLHPQAASRLETLVSARLGAAAAQLRPVPQTVLVRAMDPVLETDQWFRAGQPIAPAGVVSFHDVTGLPLCPVAVAAMIDDLVSAFPALAPEGWSANPAGEPGEVAHVARKASGVVVHVVDPHGAAWRAPSTETVVVRETGGGTRSPSASGLADLAPGEAVAPSVAAPARVRVGWARSSTLGTAALEAPTLAAGATLGRQFLRVVAVDLPWHVLGNRTATAVLGIPGDDQRLPAEFQPVVRDAVNVDFLVDGVDVLGAMGGIVDGFFGDGGTGLLFSASPVIETSVGVPPPPGATSPARAAHWPLFPPPPPAGPPGTGLAPTAFTAVWSGDQDVVVTVAGGAVTPGASLRLMPQVFQVVASIGPEPSFLRGDGSTVVVPDTNAVSLLLRNPLRLGPGDVRPAGAQLCVDAVVTQRSGVRRITANIVVPIGTGAPPAVPDPFAAPAPLDAIPAAMQGIAPSPVFGIPGAPTPGGGGPASVGDLIRRLAGETTPRSAPRLPTMARFPSIVAVGVGPTTAPLAWTAVVSGGRIGRETRSTLHALGNPGNPSGPDVHAPGVRVDGALGFDAAAVALRRAQPIVPFDDDDVDGWIPFVATSGWVPPPAGTAAAPATCAGALLRTVAVGVETPELLPDAIPEPGANASAQDVVDAIAAAVGVPAPTITVANEAQIVREVRREFRVTRNGQRDALWALRRAIGEARRLVVVASPQFCATARPEGPGDPAAHEIDLIEVLADRLAEQRSLRVVVATPRLPDHVPAFGGWIREALTARRDAVDRLRGVDPGRVVAFHPVGFPGRDVRIRTTSVVVDDIWALVGTSHWRRRGMTFDEGVDVVAIDRALDGTGASTRVREYRRGLLAQLLGVPTPTATTPADADWIRLASARGAHDLVADLVAQGGLGRIRPFWPGPTDTDVQPQSSAVADPDGASADQYLALFAGLIGESP